MIRPGYSSTYLKIALFATGLAGIVSEYTLSTLATYFLGDSILQWTMIVSIMLFSMGLGSRLSGKINNALLEKFIIIECFLSIISANVTVIVYLCFVLHENVMFIIYLLSIVVGLLIGMEIPLVIRLNEKFQTLKLNISSALEKDYYGSLVGGIFFAFIGLPYLGLTHTPFILGTINFLVALTLLIVIWSEIPHKHRKRITVYISFVSLTLLFSAFFAKDIVKWGEKVRYTDQIVYSQQSKYQKIVITYFSGNYLFFLNGHLQFSTLDEALYHEPLVHSVMQLHDQPQEILVLGGGDGLAVRELLKYSTIKKITLVDIDSDVTDLAQSHPILLLINKESLKNLKVEIINEDGFTFLEKKNNRYDVIIADFPDPRTIDLGRLYSQEFYWLCRRALTKKGIMITQAGSPYYAQSAFECIKKTMSTAGFTTLPLHNYILSLGEWGWVIGSKQKNILLKKQLQQADISQIPTQWLTNETFTAMSSFGKQVLDKTHIQIKVNKIHDPVLYKYYLNGRWDLY